MSYDLFLESLQEECIKQFEFCESGLHSLMEEVAYEVIVEGNENPSAVNSIKILIKKMVELVKNFFKKALARFQSFFIKEKDPLKDVKKFLEKHPEYKNKKITIPNITESERELYKTKGVIQVLKEKLRKRKLSDVEIDRFIREEKREDFKKKAKITIGIAAAIALVGNSIRKYKKYEKETVTDLEEFASTYTLVGSANYAAETSMIKSIAKKGDYDYKKGSREAYYKKRDMFRDSWEKTPETHQKYINYVGQKIIQANKQHLNLLDKTVGLLFGLPKRAAKKFNTATQKGVEKTISRLKTNDPNEYDRVKDYLKSKSADKIYRKIYDGIDDSTMRYL